MYDFVLIPYNLPNIRGESFLKQYENTESSMPKLLSWTTAPKNISYPTK